MFMRAPDTQLCSLHFTNKLAVRMQIIINIFTIITDNADEQSANADDVEVHSRVSSPSFWPMITVNNKNKHSAGGILQIWSGTTQQKRGHRKQNFVDVIMISKRDEIAPFTVSDAKIHFIRDGKQKETPAFYRSNSTSIVNIYVN